MYGEKGGERANSNNISCGNIIQKWLLLHKISLLLKSKELVRGDFYGDEDQDKSLNVIKSELIELISHENKFKQVAIMFLTVGRI